MYTVSVAVSKSVSGFKGTRRFRGQSLTSQNRAQSMQWEGEGRLLQPYHLLEWLHVDKGKTRAARSNSGCAPDGVM